MNYRVPADIKEKEKIIGGVLDLGQFLWCLLGIGAGFLVFALLSPFMKFFAALPALIAIGAFAPFVFYKVDEVPLPTYLKRKREFNKKTKYLPNIRIDRNW